MSQPPSYPPSQPPSSQYPQSPGGQYGYAPHGYGPQQNAGMLDAIVPTNPLAAVSCWTGILSVIFCGFGILIGPIAVITGVISLKRGAIIQQSKYGSVTTTVRSWIGITTGAIGILISLTFIVWQVLVALDRH